MDSWNIHHFAPIQRDFVVFRFMNENDEVPKIFSWADSNKNGTEQRSHPRFKNHAKAIGVALRDCLGDLNAIKKHEERLNFLGATHNKKKVQYHFYEVSFLYNFRFLC